MDGPDVDGIPWSVRWLGRLRRVNEVRRSSPLQVGRYNGGELRLPSLGLSSKAFSSFELRSAVPVIRIRHAPLRMMSYLLADMTDVGDIAEAVNSSDVGTISTGGEGVIRFAAIRVVLLVSKTVAEWDLDKVVVIRVHWDF